VHLFLLRILIEFGDLDDFPTEYRHWRIVAYGYRKDFDKHEERCEEEPLKRISDVDKVL
jgi:hypothetical protein